MGIEQNRFLKPPRAASHDKGPLLIKAAIIIVTLIALLIALKTIHAYVAPQTESDIGVNESGENSNSEEADLLPPAQESNESAESPPVTEKEPAGNAPTVAAVENSSNTINVTDEVFEPTQETINTAGELSVATGIKGRPKVGDTEIYEALVGQLHLEAQTLYTLSLPILDNQTASKYSNTMAYISIREVFAPYYQELIIEYSKLSATLTCRMLIEMTDNPEVKSEIQHITPDRNTDYFAGYPAILGHHKEISLLAWSHYLSVRGNAGLTLSRRIQGDLNALANKTGLERADQALQLYRANMPRIAAIVSPSETEEDNWRKIEATENENMRQSDDIFYRLWARTKSNTDSTRYLLTGQTP